MNNQKTVKSANSEKSAVLYIVTCALVVIQPLLDILSSIVINLGKANYISVSGAVRAVIIAAVTVFTLGFYKGKYSTLFKVYNGIAAAYIALMCLMSATRGDHVAFFYMLGLMADTFFFAFMFLLIFDRADRRTQSSPRRYSGDGAHLRADTCYKLSFKEGHVPLFDLVRRGTRSAYPDRSRFLRLPSRQKESGEHKARRCGALVDSPGGRYYLASRRRSAFEFKARALRLRHILGYPLYVDIFILAGRQKRESSAHDARISFERTFLRAHSHTPSDISREEQLRRHVQLQGYVLYI